MLLIRLAVYDSNQLDITSLDCMFHVVFVVLHIFFKCFLSSFFALFFVDISDRVSEGYESSVRAALSK